MKRHDRPPFPRSLPGLPPDCRQALDLPNSPPHNSQQSKNNIPRNTTLIRPFRARTCAHSLACWKVETPCGPSCSSLISAVRRGLPCQPGLLQVLTCALSIRLGHPPCPSACSHLLCLPVRVEGASTLWAWASAGVGSRSRSVSPWAAHPPGRPRPLHRAQLLADAHGGFLNLLVTL